MKSLSSSSVASKPKPPGQTGFAKVVAGGQVIRPDAQLPFIERMITGTATPDLSKVQSRESAILESVASNIEAGINIVDRQEMGLAKIGGKLADISLSLNRCKSPKATISIREQAQADPGIR